MPDNISKVQRWLDLITYLVTRHFPVPVEELMERLPAYAVNWVSGSEKARDSVRRKFERDKDELRAFGIPLETVTYSINRGMEEAQGYRLSKKNFYLPYLKLLKEETTAPDDTRPDSDSLLSENLDLFRLASDGSVEVGEEVVADALWGLKELADVPGFPMAAEARSAYRKFTFDLDPEPPAEKYVFFAIPPETARAEAHLEVLSDALLRRKKVTFPYHGIERNQLTERVVRPFGLLFKHSHWYLVGWDETRDRLRGCLLGLATGDAIGTTVRGALQRFPKSGDPWSGSTGCRHTAANPGLEVFGTLRSFPPHPKNPRRDS